MTVISEKSFLLYLWPCICWHRSRFSVPPFSSRTLAFLQEEAHTSGWVCVRPGLLGRSQRSTFYHHWDRSMPESSAVAAFLLASGNHSCLDKPQGGQWKTWPLSLLHVPLCVVGEMMGMLLVYVQEGPLGQLLRAQPSPTPHN